MLRRHVSFYLDFSMLVAVIVLQAGVGGDRE